MDNYIGSDRSFLDDNQQLRMANTRIRNRPNDDQESDDESSNHDTIIDVDEEDTIEGEDDYENESDEEEEDIEFQYKSFFKSNMKYIIRVFKK